ncbi:serine/threonine protein kinase [Saccharopolyspora rhizosphaerae]|uniref:non-specific serine/threonine protein kinase n=1 Tax=Saccharopolyspora rhizosphaerae TaxID=2492662 RepID=A0A426JL16_9PSEU|nr:serine/threonine-protein kinase [Saccharopolyspora rhizosphaerae]RRO13765.1 serine/threonine protein kinase [Saccharopolyspora rhizosphaerae]
MLTTGQLLAERYRLGRRIAVGGMGEVWEAVDVRLDRTVAVKVLKAELCGDAEFLHRFRTEARTTASLNHPGIAAVHDYGETAAVPDGPEDTAYLVMELVEGEPLAAILARERRINTDHVMDMLEQAGQALQAAHERSLVHRDVKPGNILITPDGKVKLTDFGIAKAADAAPVTRNGMVMGTAHYIAPEQALGSDATPASDVYSLAVVGYECLMGHRPFLSENAVTVAMMHIREIAPPLPPDVPPGVRALVEATLVKDPRRRYADGGEFAAAVAAVRAGRPLPTPSAVVAQQQRPVNAPGPGTGVHPVVPGSPPMGGTYPPGVIPPQQPGTPQPAQQAVQQQAGQHQAGQPQTGQQHQVSPQQAPMPMPTGTGVAGAMGGNAHRRTGNSRIVMWIVVVFLAVVLLVAIGLLTYWAVGRFELGMAGPGPVADLSLDSTNGLGQTSHRQEPMIGKPAGEMGRSLTRIGTTIR